MKILSLLTDFIFTVCTLLIVCIVVNLAYRNYLQLSILSQIFTVMLCSVVMFKLRKYE